MSAIAAVTCSSTAAIPPPAAGNIGVTASGNITYTNNVSAGGYLTFNAAGQVSDNNQGNALSAGIKANITGSLDLYSVTGGTAINLIATAGNASFTSSTATTGDVDVTDAAAPSMAATSPPAAARSA